MSRNPAEIAKEAIHQLSLQVDLGDLETLAQIAHLRSQADQIGLGSKDIQKLYELEAKATSALINILQAESVNLMANVSEDELKETGAFVKSAQRHKIPHLGACIDFQNNVTFTFVKYVLTSNNPHEAAMRITQLIRIAEQFRQKGNFYMFMALIAVFGNANVSRLKLTFSMLTKNKLNLFSNFEVITDEHDSFSNLRSAQSEKKYYDSFIPSLSLLMNDLARVEGEDVPDPSLSPDERDKLQHARRVTKDTAKSKVLEEFRLFKLNHDLSQSIGSYQKFKIDPFQDQITADQSSDTLRKQAKELEQQNKLGKLSSRAGAALMTHLASTISSNKTATTTQIIGETPLDLQQTVNLHETSLNRTVVAPSDLTQYRNDIINGGIDHAIAQLTHNVSATNKLLLYRNINDSETDDRFSDVEDIKLILDITRLQLALLKSAKQGNNELYIKIWTSLSDYKSQLSKLVDQNKSIFIKRFNKLQVANEAYNELALQQFKQKLHGTPQQEIQTIIDRLYELHNIAFEKAKTEPMQNVMLTIEEINQWRTKINQLSANDEYLSFREQLKEALEFDKKYMKNLNEMLANRREALSSDQGFSYTSKSLPQSVVPQPIPIEDVEMNFDDVDELIKPVAAPLDNFILLIWRIKQKCDELKSISVTHITYNEQEKARVSLLLDEITYIKTQLSQAKKNIDLEVLFREIDNVVKIYQEPQEPILQTNSPRSPVISSSSSHESISLHSQDFSENRGSTITESNEARDATISATNQNNVEVFQPLIQIEQSIVPIRKRIDAIFKYKTITEKERKELISHLKVLTAQLQPFLDVNHYYHLQHIGSGLGTSYPPDKQKFNKEFFEYNDAARRAFNIYQALNYLSVKIESEKITVVPESQSLMSWIKSTWNGFKNLMGFGTPEQDTTTKIVSITGIPKQTEEHETETKIAKKETKPFSKPAALRASRFKGKEAADSSAITPTSKHTRDDQPKKHL